MKYYLPLFVLLFATFGNAHAFNGYYSPPAQPLQNPVQTIQQALDKLQKFSANKDNTNPVLLRGFIDKEIIPHFAFDQMTYWIAGPFARHMKADQFKELEAEVKKSFLNSLDQHLSAYNASTSRVSMQRAQYRGRNEVVVSTLLIGNKQRPDRLDFRMKSDGNSWKIIDITANGMSAALYYRKHFMSTLRQYRRTRSY